MPPNMMPIVGRDSLRVFQQNTFATGKWDFDLKTDDVVSGDIFAVERGHYHAQGDGRPQGPVSLVQGPGELRRVVAQGQQRTLATSLGGQGQHSAEAYLMVCLSITAPAAMPRPSQVRSR